MNAPNTVYLIVDICLYVKNIMDRKNFQLWTTQNETEILIIEKLLHLFLFCTVFWSYHFVKLASSKYHKE